MLTDQRICQIGEPMAMETIFGWVLVGPIQPSLYDSITSFCVAVFETLDRTLKKFWELEEQHVHRGLTPEESIAENFYQETTTECESTLELANVDRSKYLKAAKALLHDTFVEDIITGENTDKLVFECQQ